ncbi:MAG: M20/M25/M40 family metallo-hydrolase, partial [Acidimicrobiales bacterium]
MSEAQGAPGGQAALPDGLMADAEALLEPMIELRRRIHSHPELGLQLPKTQELVLDALDGLGLDVATGDATTSVVAVLHGDGEGPTTLLRGDMDALPMPEDTGLDFASREDGVMHACGHDAHVAMLVGAARLLSRRRRELAGRVV